METAPSGLWPKEIRLTVCLNEALNDELRRAAVQQDKPLSAIIRGILTAWAIERERGRPDHAESGPASSIVISPFEQRLHAAAQSFCYNHKAARLAFECLHVTSIGAGSCSHKLHSLAAARASDALAVVHWNMSPSRNSQGGPLGPETSPSAGTVCNNRAN
jgi:hypothetical protein